MHWDDDDWPDLAGDIFDGPRTPLKRGEIAAAVVIVLALVGVLYLIAGSGG